MIAIPALDLRSGSCVQLGGASSGNPRGHFDDPLSISRDWSAHGFRRLHMTDLDAASRRGSNEELIRDILGDHALDIQVAGGIRSGETIERLLAEGAHHVVLGVRALEEMEWLAEMTSLFPKELIVAADVRDRRIVSRGRGQTLPRDILDAVAELNDLPLAGILITAVHKEGRLEGTDLPLMEDVAELSYAPVLASGGVTTMDELRALADRGVAGTIIGMALYSGALDPRLVAEEFAE